MSTEQERIVVIDIGKCDGCRECEKACSMKHSGVKSPEHSRIRIEEFPDGNLYVPVLCQACEDSLCVKVCPMNARFKLKNGAIVTDEEKCIGCRTCVYICPIGAPVENPVSEKLMTCDRCTEDEGIPLCAKACLEQKALRFLDAKDVISTTTRDYAIHIKKAYRRAGLGKKFTK